MAETRTTLTLYPRSTRWLDSGSCSSVGSSVSKRVDLLAARYMALMEALLPGRERLSDADFAGIEALTRNLLFTTLSDPSLLPAVMRLRAKDLIARGAPGGSEANSLTFKLEGLAPPALAAVADLIERYRAAVPDEQERTVERYQAWAEAERSGTAAPKQA